MLTLFLSLLVIVLLAVLLGWIVSMLTPDVRIRNIVVIVFLIIGIIYLLQ